MTSVQEAYRKKQDSLPDYLQKQKRFTLMGYIIILDFLSHTHLSQNLQKVNFSKMWILTNMLITGWGTGV